MRLFAVNLLLTFVLLAGVFGLITSSPIKSPIALPIHKTLYLDRNIHDDKMCYILEAILEWNKATDSKVIFDLKRLPQSDIIASDAIVIINVSLDYPEIITLDNTNKHSTLGFFSNRGPLPYIGLVDERIKNNDYVAVVLHELGHAIGLTHVHGDDNVGALMFPYISYINGHITNIDLMGFCDIYDCNAADLQPTIQIQ